MVANEPVDDLQRRLQQLKEGKLRERHGALVIEKGQQLLARLEETDNAYIRQALIEAYWDWHREADRTVGGAS